MAHAADHEADPGVSGGTRSGLRRFGLVLIVYQDYRMRVRGLDEMSAEALIDEIESVQAPATRAC